MGSSITYRLHLTLAVFLIATLAGCTVTVSDAGSGGRSVGEDVQPGDGSEPAADGDTADGSDTSADPGPDADTGPGTDTDTGDDGTTAAEPDLGELEGPPPVDFVVEEETRTEQQVSAAAGGTVRAVGSTTMSLEIPPGALPEDTVVSLTIASDPASNSFTFMALFEPQGLELNELATLVIDLDPPLPPGEELSIIQAPVNDPDLFIDIGLLAEVSQDGSQVRIPVEHFSAGGCILNCHGHSVRRVVQALLARGMTKDQIIAQIRERVGDRLRESDQSADQAYAALEENFDRLGDFQSCPASARQLQAYLNTFYTLASAEHDARSTEDGTTIDGTSDACIENLRTLAQTSDLPPVLNFGRVFTISPDPDGGDGATVFFTSLPHSAPLIVRGEGDDGRVVIENGTVLSNNLLAVELQVARNDHPTESAGEIPRVIAVDLDDLDRFRGLRSGEGLKEELRRWGVSLERTDQLVQGGTQVPWGAVRIWVPQGTSPDLCDQDDDTRGTVSSTFDNGDEGWSLVGDVEEGTGDPDFQFSGGNPGGHLTADDDVRGGVWYWQAPEKFHGNFAGAYAQTLTFDLTQSDTIEQFDAVDVILSGGGITLTLDNLSNPGTSWTGYTVTLDESAGWTKAGAAATQADVQAVLSALDDLQIRGEYISGPDTGGLDNVVLNVE